MRLLFWSLVMLADLRLMQCAFLRVYSWDDELTESVEAVWSDLQAGPGYWACALGRGLIDQSEQFGEEAGRRVAAARERERRLHWSVAALQRQLERHSNSQWVGT